MPKESFAEKVKKIVAGIPKGKILTYKQVAAKAGSPNAARAVGSIMKANYVRRFRAIASYAPMES